MRPAPAHDVVHAQVLPGVLADALHDQALPAVLELQAETSPAGRGSPPPPARPARGRSARVAYDRTPDVWRLRLASDASPARGSSRQKFAMNVVRLPCPRPPGKTPCNSDPSKTSSRFGRAAATQALLLILLATVWSKMTVGPPTDASRNVTVDTSGCRGGAPSRNPGTLS